MRKEEACPYYEECCNTEKCFCAKYKAFIDAKDEILVKKELEELGIDKDTPMLEKMMKMQSYFAARFHEVENPSKEVTDRWNKEYCICIEDEIEELFDYIMLPFDSSDSLYTDDNEMKKEVIDILHFMMDMFISGGCSAEEIISRYLKTYTRDILAVKDGFNFAFYHTVSTIEKEHESLVRNGEITVANLRDGYDTTTNRIFLHTRALWSDNWHEISFYRWNQIMLDYALRLLFVNRRIRQQISWKHWKKPSDTIDKDQLFDVYLDLFSRFMKLAVFVFDTPEQIVDTYIHKNVENILRQKYEY